MILDEGNQVCDFIKSDYGEPFLHSFSNEEEEFDLTQQSSIESTNGFVNSYEDQVDQEKLRFVNLEEDPSSPIKVDSYRRISDGQSSCRIGSHTETLVKSFSVDPRNQEIVPDDFNEDKIPIYGRSLSKACSRMNNSYPELMNYETVIRDGASIILRSSRFSILYAISGTLPPYVSIVCLLFSGRLNAVRETGAFALGVAISNVLWGVGLSISAGMDLTSAGAAVDEMWHVCWKLLTKSCCVSFWFFVITIIPFLFLQYVADFPTVLLNRILGNGYGSIATATINICSVGFVANFLFESCHRFLSYQSRSDAQVMVSTIGAIIHSILLLLFVPGYGPMSAAVISSSIAILRSLAIVFYIYWRRYELGWQAGVRVRLFERQRRSEGSRSRLRGMRMSGRSVVDRPTSPETKPVQRRQRRAGTSRPGADLTDLLSSLQTGPGESGKVDLLHPLTAASYSQEKEEEKLKSLEKEAERWYKDEAEKGSPKESNLMPGSENPSKRIGVDMVDNIQKDYSIKKYQRNKRKVNTPRPAFYSNEECRTDTGTDTSVSPRKSTDKRTTTNELGSERGTSAPSLFQMKRMRKKVAIESRESDEGEESKMTARRRDRKNTVLMVRLVSVDNSILLEGWCLPTSLSWKSYWTIQRPRHVKETMEFLSIAIPSTLLLSYESLVFDFIIIIISLLRPNYLSLISLIINLDILLISIPLAVSSAVGGPISGLIRLDNQPHARTLLHMAGRIILSVTILNTFIIFFVGWYLNTSLLFTFDGSPNDDLASCIPACFCILALINVADSISMLGTTMMRYVGSLVKSLLTSSILLLSIPITMTIGMLLFSLYLPGCLIILLGHLIILCFVSFYQLLNSTIFTSNTMESLSQDYSQSLALKSYRRGPTECHSLFIIPDTPILGRRQSSVTDH